MNKVSVALMVVILSILGNFSGLLKYVQQVALLRAIGHFKFAFVKFEILNSNVSVDEGRITVRWRINGISGLRVLIKNTYIALIVGLRF